MQVLSLTLDEPGKSSERREDTDNIILRQAKIKMLAYKGAFDGLVAPVEISLARKGYMPNGFEMHHIVPLCCSNTELSIDNMVIIEKSAHVWLHNNVYYPALSKCAPGQSCSVFLPDMDPKKVITLQAIQPFVEEYSTKLLAKHKLCAIIMTDYINKHERN